MIVATASGTGQLTLPPLVAIVGPTAVGKTATAIRLARDIDGEVVSADSRYLYRGMDIGTAKPSEAEMAGIPHHLIDLLDPVDDYSLALYQQDAYQAIDDIHRRGRIPILAGGTPLYVNAVLEGWRIPHVPPDPDFRAEMERLAEIEGNEALHRRLAAVDPPAAERIPSTNLRRVIRALEIYHHTGQRMTDLEGKSPPPYRILRIGLTLPREELFRRIDQRVEEQIKAGLVAEVQRLLDSGVPPDAPSMSAIGYAEILPYLRGEQTLAEAMDQIRFNTHRYARHQLTWLRRMPNVHWFDPREPDTYARLLDLVQQFLAGNETDPSGPGVD